MEKNKAFSSTVIKIAAHLQWKLSSHVRNNEVVQYYFGLIANVIFSYSTKWHCCWAQQTIFLIFKTSFTLIFCSASCARYKLGLSEGIHHLYCLHLLCYTKFVGKIDKGNCFKMKQQLPRNWPWNSTSSVAEVQGISGKQRVWSFLINDVYIAL